MRYITASLLLVYSLVYADAYKLKWYGEHIVYEPEQFTLIDNASGFDFYVVNTSINSDKNIQKRILTLVIFDKEKILNPIDTPVKRMYTEGTINCDTGIATLLVEFWVDVGDNLVFAYNQALSENKVELLTPNTSRNKLYKKVCNK